MAKRRLVITFSTLADTEACLRLLEAAEEEGELSSPFEVLRVEPGELNTLGERQAENTGGFRNE